MKKQANVSAPKADVYQTITDSIVELIEAGQTEPWRLPWRKAGLQMPTNAFTKKAYNGVNIIQLWATAHKKGFESPYYASYKQWKELGATVIKGSKGIPVVFYKTVVKETENQDSQPVTGGSDQDEKKSTKKIWIARCSYVFNAEQVEGWDGSSSTTSSYDLNEANERAETFVKNTGADVRYGGLRAYYDTVEDYVRVPKRSVFIDTETGSATEHYYATLFHELIHYSGHPSRCNRNLKNRFGDCEYAFEELIAELGAAFLCADLQVKNCSDSWADSAAYLESWLKVMKSDAKALFFVAARASEGAKYLLNVKCEIENEE